jgi:hypothetical protein
MGIGDVGADLGQERQGIEHPEVGPVTGVDRLPRVEDCSVPRSISST